MVSCRFLPSTNPMKLTAGDIWPALWRATLWQSSLWNHGENGMMTVWSCGYVKSPCVTVKSSIFIHAPWFHSYLRLPEGKSMQLQHMTSKLHARVSGPFLQVKLGWVELSQVVCPLSQIAKKPEDVSKTMEKRRKSFLSGCSGTLWWYPIPVVSTSVTKFGG